MERNMKKGFILSLLSSLHIWKQHGARFLTLEIFWRCCWLTGMMLLLTLFIPTQFYWATCSSNGNCVLLIWSNCQTIWSDYLGLIADDAPGSKPPESSVIGKLPALWGFLAWVVSTPGGWLISIGDLWNGKGFFWLPQNYPHQRRQSCKPYARYPFIKKQGEAMTKHDQLTKERSTHRMYTIFT